MELLKTENLTKKYISKTVLDNLNLTIEEGKVYGLLGPNASGKTTFMKIIAGLSQPTSGKLEINGCRVGVLSKEIVSFMPTTNCLPGWMKVHNCLSYFNDMFKDFDLDRANELVDFMGLKSEQKVSALSTGILGRLKLILAICRNAKLYVLDEPLNGLDPISREKVIEVILLTCQQDKTVLISSHLIDDLESVLDEVIFLDKGKVALLGNAENLRIEREKSILELYKEVYKDA